MVDGGMALLFGGVILLAVGAVTMRIYWQVVDPWLRRSLGRLLGCTIYLGEQNIWQINEESVDSLNPRNLIVRPAQILSLMTAALVPLLVTVAVLMALSR
ncbi:MAG: hypothetical protein HXY41_00950 [Chloroflexi bacterium]|nr:hypothetical protein [Chloroflexota bacterium]